VQFQSYCPAPPLAGLVESLWSLSDAPPHARERILPSGTLELVINLHEDQFRIYDVDAQRPPRRYRGAIVSGAYRGAFVIDTEEHASVIGVHFAPGGALPFLGAPPGELADTHVDLETLWPRQAGELRERLCEASSPIERFRILEHVLIARLAAGGAPRPEVRAAIEHLSHPRRPVAEIADLVGLSHRRFIQLFTAEVGTSPKVFVRLQRFQRAMAAIQQGRSVNWAALALGCGYYDQSHMIKDFGEFAGFSPAELPGLRSAQVKANHVALADDARSNSSNTPRGPDATFSHRGRPDDHT
jgi:AraC-like DNA-binding protein